MKAIDNVPDNADAERVLRDLCEQGYKLIFATSFGYMNGAHKVAKDFPDVKFEHCTGFKTAENIGVYAGRFYEGRYLAGMIAAAATKTNNLGYVAAFPDPRSAPGHQRLHDGRACREPERAGPRRLDLVLVRPGQGKRRRGEPEGPELRRRDAPHGLRRGGARRRKGEDPRRRLQHLDAEGGADDAVGGLRPRLDAVLHRARQPGHGRHLEGREHLGRHRRRMVDLIAVADDVPADAKARMEDVRQKLLKREWNVFTGPIVTNEGREVCAAGKTLTDADLLLDELSR